MQWKIGIPFPCLFCFTYFLFYCVGIIILRTCNGEKTVKRTLYVRKAGARKLFISKDYPSVKTQMVFSDYVKCRILVLRLQGNYPRMVCLLYMIPFSCQDRNNKFYCPLQAETGATSFTALTRTMAAVMTHGPA